MPRQMRPRRRFQSASDRQLQKIHRGGPAGSSQAIGMKRPPDRSGSATAACPRHATRSVANSGPEPNLEEASEKRRTSVEAESATQFGLTFVALMTVAKLSVTSLSITSSAICFDRA